MLLEPFLYYPGRTVAQPLPILLLVLFASAAAALRRPSRRLAAVTLAATLLLALLSLPAMSFGLERLIAVDSGIPRDPQAIVVLAGGWRPGLDRTHDVLSPATLNRVVAAAELWKRYPQARFIVSGTDRYSPSLRQSELMRDEAVRRGVDPRAIAMEATSRNTREHPLHVRQVMGITANTRMVVVTSSTHIRRTRRSFRRYFTDAAFYPADRPRRAAVNSFVPSAIALQGSTHVVQECIGIAWYALLDAASRGESALRAAPARVR